MHKLLIIAGSVRHQSYTPKVATYVKQIALQNPNWQVDLISPTSVSLKFEDEGQAAKNLYPELTAKIIAADAFVIICPEYNHSFPGSLKYLLDLHFDEYERKPVGIVGVSNGVFGGARAIQALIPVVRKLGMILSRIDVNFSSVDKVFVENKVSDPATWSARINRQLDDLLWLAKTLKPGRTTK